MPVWGLGLYRQWHRSQWPRGLSFVTAATRFLWLLVRILQGAWAPESVVFVLSSRGFCDGPIRMIPTEWLCGSLSIIRCNNNSLLLQWVGRKSQN